MENGLNEQGLIGPLLCEPGQQAREAAKRKRSNLQITVAEGDAEARAADGWVFQKKVKGRKARLQKPLSIDAQLENRVWLLFYLMGYREIGGGRDFRIRFTRKNEQGRRDGHHRRMQSL
jgi:hypothetical protein